MKTFISLLFLTQLCDCSQHKNETERTFVHFDSTLKELHAKIADDLNILGSWRLESETSAGAQLSFNQGPLVIFRFDGSGTTQEINSFRWALNNKTLKIIYDQARPDNIFSDTLYKAILVAKNDLKELLISNDKTESYYVLGKTD